MGFILNYIMATFHKTQVSILNGIVMGGGAAVSMHGRFRVATENSVFAMRETALGLFPDQGASYYLSRLPVFFGEYVGLTGTRLDGAEMLACGLATHFVPSALVMVASVISNGSCKVPQTLPILLESQAEPNFQRKPPQTHFICVEPEIKRTKGTELDVIDRCFSRRTVEEILSALEREALNSNDDWISATIQSLKGASPMSLKISLRSIRQGRLQGVGQCLVREYRMICHVMRGKVSKDFFEVFSLLKTFFFS
ncbi:3-hydroxyisobutyryl-CoA hydrolase 1-like [Alnus glutinosa]|uniref:3-hydroxyisobutyryl-CoA hydrolase 1-like n=1 Tax=Alnus glutinosa TaxID=3517 RepID=UPI002D76CB83|nr:3-hydroxyisobutyryl-CoA hydrolase 1-like [Alnus glutinosa]